MDAHHFLGEFTHKLKVLALFATFLTKVFFASTLRIQLQDLSFNDCGKQKPYFKTFR